MKSVVWGGLGVFACTMAAAAAPPQLIAPLICEPNVTCFVQNHVDLDPGPGFRDPFCGTAGYDGHKGVDFRVMPEAGPVAVVASAAGRVKGTRDGMQDVLLRDIDREDVADRECGNGVAIDHGDGWETQYCHLRRGSVRVRTGDEVAAGDVLGEVGFSGAADFVHVHLSVRQDGRVVDPYTLRESGGDCVSQARAVEGLWQDEVARAFAYRPGQIVETGFAAAPPDLRALETENDRYIPAAAASAALIFFVRSINLRQGDRIAIKLAGPEGFSVASDGTPLDRNKATYVSFTGKRLRAARWPAGVYEAQAEIIRDDKAIETIRDSIRLD